MNEEENKTGEECRTEECLKLLKPKEKEGSDSRYYVGPIRNVVWEDKKKVGSEQSPPEGDETTDTAAIMGILTASCQLAGEKDQRESCWAALTPLHKGEKKAVETLKEHLLSYGEGLDKAEKRLKWLIDTAKKEIEEGK